MKVERKIKRSSRVRAISTQSDEHSVLLVLSEPGDESAAWLARELPSYAGHPVLHMTSRDVDEAIRAESDADAEGEWFSLTSRDGRTLHSRRLAGVVNRLGSAFASGAEAAGQPHSPGWLGSSAPMVRWLQTWRGVVLNRPTAESPSSDLLPSFWWMERALSAGFLGPDEEPSPRGLRETSFRAVVVGDEVFPANRSDKVVPEALVMRCLRMARASSVSSLGIDATRAESGGWRFVSADLRPDLRACGEAGLRAVARALEKKPAPETTAFLGGGI